MSALGGVVHFDATNSFGFNLGDNGSTEWDVDGDGHNDFVFEANGSSGVHAVNGAYLYARIQLDSDGGRYGRGLVRADADIRPDDFRLVASSFSVGPALAGGYNLGNPGQSRRTVVSAYTYSSGNASTGPGFGEDFRGGQTGSNLIGFAFENASGIHYGWAELIVTPITFDVTINQWAYDDVADTAIHIADTGPTGAPSPGSLALLALGAAGIRRFRGRQQALAA